MPKGRGEAAIILEQEFEGFAGAALARPWQQKADLQVRFIGR